MQNNKIRSKPGLHPECKISNQYDLGETIGKGHYAVVRTAKHCVSGENVAVKVIDKTKLDDVSRAHLFQEVRCMKLVQHPNVVRLFEVIDTQTKLYLVLELGDGGDMYDYISKHDKGLPEVQAKRYFIQIVNAISYCHQLHVVHRDLKLENIVLFANSDVIKLTDFGFSNKFVPGRMLDTSCGSLAYSAPEILLGESYHAPAVDVWSLGVILYMLVNGHPPFQEASDSETLIKIMDCQYTLPEHCSHSCQDLIGQMLRREPSNRISLINVEKHIWISMDIQDTSSSLAITPHQPLIGRVSLCADDHSCIVNHIVNAKIATRDEIARSLESGAYNHIAATYYLLGEKMLRKRASTQRLSDSNISLPTPPTSPESLSPAPIQSFKKLQTTPTMEEHRLRLMTDSQVTSISSPASDRTIVRPSDQRKLTPLAILKRCSLIAEELAEEDEDIEEVISESNHMETNLDRSPEMLLPLLDGIGLMVGEQNHSKLRSVMLNQIDEETDEHSQTSEYRIAPQSSSRVASLERALRRSGTTETNGVSDSNCGPRVDSIGSLVGRRRSTLVTSRSGSETSDTEDCVGGMRRKRRGITAETDRCSETRESRDKARRVSSVTVESAESRCGRNSSLTNCVKKSVSLIMGRATVGDLKGSYQSLPLTLSNGVVNSWNSWNDLSKLPSNAENEKLKKIFAKKPDFNTLIGLFSNDQNSSINNGLVNSKQNFNRGVTRTDFNKNSVISSEEGENVKEGKGGCLTRSKCCSVV